MREPGLLKSHNEKLNTQLLFFFTRQQPSGIGIQFKPLYQVKERTEHGNDQSNQANARTCPMITVRNSSDLI